jgi:8-oxo-dGTP diphosphatase
MLLLRHASAGERLSSPSADRARGLDHVGRADARRLVAMLADYSIDRIVTSPQARCFDTVVPLARARGLDIECREELALDASRRDTRALLAELPDTSLVCTHREVIERLFDGRVACEKGGAWVLQRKARSIQPVSYLPPPARTERGVRRRVSTRADVA